MLTDVELTVLSGENTVGNDSHIQMAQLAPGYKFELELRSSDDPRAPLQVIVEVRAAGGVQRRIVVDIPARGRPRVTERPAP